MLRNRSEAEFLPAELEILDSPPWPLARVILWMMMALLLIAVVWSYFGRLDIVASARGIIIPDSRTKVIQSAVAGKVTSIEVANGDAVEAGDVLVKLDTVSATAAYDKSAADLHAALLAAAMARTLAAVDFHDPENTAVPRLEDLPELADVPADQIQAQQDVLDSLFHRQQAKAAQFISQRATQQAALRLQNEQAASARKLIAQEEQVVSVQLSGLEEQLGVLNKEHPMLQREVNIARNLQEKGIISIGGLHVEEAKLLRLEGRRDELINDIKQSQAEGARSLEQRRKELRQYQNQAAEINARIAQLESAESLNMAEFKSSMVDQAAGQSRLARAKQQEIIQIGNLLANHSITAPEAGVVEQLAVHTPGAVVQPSQALLVVVPKDARLIAEVDILNKDIGFISEGQDVRVKVDTFLYTKYGLVEGKVMDIADDAVEQEGIGPVFKTQVRLLKNEVFVDDQSVKLRPGMSVTAEVKTGTRRVIEFFLDPFLRTRDESLNVR